MTVVQLIERLSEFDPNLPVVMPSEWGDFCEVASVFADLVAPYEDRLQLTDEREPGWASVVRLYEAEPD